jgi:hypothetical protein
MVCLNGVFYFNHKGDPTVRIPAFQRGGQGFESNGEKINPLMATEVHLRRLRAIQKGSRRVISRLAISSRKPMLQKKIIQCIALVRE